MGKILNKELQAYYTKNNYITDYMVNMLDIKNNEHIFEPCVGDGVFIEALLKNNVKTYISAVDLNESEVSKLKKKYGFIDNINIRCGDTLFDKDLDLMIEKEKYFDKIIGNPPYGAWQDMNKRNLLKKKYGSDAYVKETYSLFIFRCISLLKDEGKLSFIIPDTFLYLHNHEKLRSMILNDTVIEEILLFPSKLFPGVSFGYSKLCIITLKKSGKHKFNLNNNIRIYPNIKTNEDIDLLTKGNSDLSSLVIKQADIKLNPSSAFYLTENNIINHFKIGTDSLGDYAKVVTGIYTGDNKRFIYKADESVKRAKGYSVVPKEKVYKMEANLEGIENDKNFIPFAKGSSDTKYFQDKDQWFIDWSKEAVSHYHNDKKARFQNSNYYFKQGIVIPMIKSSKLNATYITNRVFDQSLVGIFPYEYDMVNYFLAFLNSDVAVELLKIINPTANNSANYVKKLPIILPNKEVIKKIDSLVEKIKISRSIEEKKIYHSDLNKIFKEIYKK